MSVTIDLAGRVALVTGGIKGVGLGITQQLLAAGATVYTCARSEADAVAGSTHLVCDVRSPEAVAGLLQAIMDQEAKFDILVNNAGGAPYALAADVSTNFHQKIVELNLLSPLLMMQAANKLMQQQKTGGAIVNISSVSALRPSPGTAAYGAAKAGVDSLTKSLAIEWAPKVRLNSINVGMVRTEQTDLHYGGESGVARIAETVPVGRLATPKDVGGIVAFLASDLASYVTGTSLECHGGGESPAFLAAAEK